MSPAKDRRAAGRGRVSEKVSAFLSCPLVALCITVAIRLAVYYYRPNIETLAASKTLWQPTLAEITNATPGAMGVGSYDEALLTPAFFSSERRQLFHPLALRFAATMPSTEVATWRGLVHWRDTFTAPLPDHLVSLAPWYVRYMPSVLSKPPLTVIWLSLCDGLTAYIVSDWPSCTPWLLYPFFVISPFSILPAAWESLVPLECAALAVVMHCCWRRRRSPFLLAIAVAVAVALGSSFVALPVALLYPVGVRKTRDALLAGVVAAAALSAYATGYLYSTEQLSLRVALHAPPDCGTVWYVRQVVLPTFARCLELLQVQLPVYITIMVAFSMPSFRRVVGPGGKVFEPLFVDRKVCLTLFALMFSVLLRRELTIPYCALVLLFIYSSLNLKASATVTTTDMTVERNPYVRVRLIVPFFIVLLSLPMELSFYTGWVLREVANGNWIFFSQVGFVIAATVFTLIWFNELVKDALMMERALSKAEPNASTLPPLTAMRTEKKSSSTLAS